MKVVIKLKLNVCITYMEISVWKFTKESTPRIVYGDNIFT